MESTEHLEIAKSLMRCEPLPKTSWCAPTLAKWLRDDCKCVYCGKDMLESYDTAYYDSCLDHLLPVSTYEELAHENWNLILSCRTCNGFKGHYDPNADQIYERGSRTISESYRSQLIDRAKAHVSEKRAARQTLFGDERELILQKLRIVRSPVRADAV